MAQVINLRPIKDDRSAYFSELLMADESEKVVNSYINDGELYAIEQGNGRAGVILFTFHEDKVVELKNMAVHPEYRGKGIGKQVINEAFSVFKERGFHKMIVGTANSSIDNLAFYQKAGFRIKDIKKGFFEKYPEPIFEMGIRARDLVMFEKDLTETEEMIAVFDENCNKLGVASREEVHAKGLWHETFQCWFVGQNAVYLQIRSNRKKDYPSLLDITAAGHILAHETIADGVREIEEELGIAVTYENLQPAGIIENCIFTDTIIDREFANVFVYETDEPLSFKLQKEEVAGMVQAQWRDFERFCLGEMEKIKVSGFIVSAAGEEVTLEKYVTKQDFVPHPAGYWEQVAKAIATILDK